MLALELLDSSKEAAAQIFLTRAVQVLLDLAPSHAAVLRAPQRIRGTAERPQEPRSRQLVKADPLAQRLRGIEAKSDC